MELVNLYSSTNVDELTKVERVKEIYELLKIPSLTNNLIDTYYNKAMESLSLVEGDKSELIRFAKMLKSREN